MNPNPIWAAASGASNMGGSIKCFQYGRVWPFIDLIEASERNFS